MRQLRDLLGVALDGLAAKRVRTVLVALGPMLGVAAMVGVIGIGDSTRGELRALLRELGTELIVVSAQPTVGDDGRSRLPLEAVARVERLPSVARVAGATRIDGVLVRPSRHPAGPAAIAPTSVWVVDDALLDALGVPLAHGRFVTDWDDRAGVRVVVLGSRLAALYGLRRGEVRTVLLADHPYAVVGALADTRLVPELEWAALIPAGAARRDWTDDLRPSTLFVRSVVGGSAATAAVLPVAITYGGPGLPAVSIPSSLLEADARIDATLRTTAFAMGALALFVGAIGIANVLTISVLQRSAEIGVRRALGHTRLVIAGQFLLEAAVIGSAGSLVGALGAVGVVSAVSASQGWVVVIDPEVVLLAVGLAVAVSVVAGIYPAWRAARLHPLEALRA